MRIWPANGVLSTCRDRYRVADFALRGNTSHLVLYSCGSAVKRAYLYLCVACLAYQFYLSWPEVQTVLGVGVQLLPFIAVRTPLSLSAIMSLSEKLIIAAKNGNTREVRKLLGRGALFTKDQV